MVYLLEDGRQLKDKQLIQDGEQFIEIPDFIEPREEDGFIIYVAGIEDGNPKYAKEPTPKPEPTISEKIYEVVIKNQDDLRQEGANMMMEELIKRGVVK